MLNFKCYMDVSIGVYNYLCSTILQFSIRQDCKNLLLVMTTKKEFHLMENKWNQGRQERMENNLLRYITVSLTTLVSNRFVHIKVINDSEIYCIVCKQLVSILFASAQLFYRCKFTSMCSCSQHVFDIGCIIHTCISNCLPLFIF